MRDKTAVSLDKLRDTDNLRHSKWEREIQQQAGVNNSGSKFKNRNRHSSPDRFVSNFTAIIRVAPTTNGQLGTIYISLQGAG